MVPKNHEKKLRYTFYNRNGQTNRPVCATVSANVRDKPDECCCCFDDNYLELTSYASFSSYFLIFDLGACDHSVCLYSLVFGISKRDKS